MKGERLQGMVAATHTPFDGDGALALEVVKEQARHLSAQGIGTVFISGSTGEGHSLTRDERAALFEEWAGVSGEYGIEVISHVGSNCLEDARYLAGVSRELGLRATSALAPNYYKPGSLEVLVEWCAAIAQEASPLPFYYYDIPVLTGVSFPMPEFLRLAAKRIPNLAGIKYTNDNLADYREALAVGNFDLAWGIDEKLVDAVKAGAVGAVGSSYNFAAPLYHELLESLANGDEAKARELQARAVALIELLASHGYLAAAKCLLGWQGVPVGPPRLPITPVADESALRDELAEAGFLELCGV